MSPFATIEDYWYLRWTKVASPMWVRSMLKSSLPREIFFSSRAEGIQAFNASLTLAPFSSHLACNQELAQAFVLRSTSMNISEKCKRVLILFHCSDSVDLGYRQNGHIVSTWSRASANDTLQSCMMQKLRQQFHSSERLAKTKPRWWEGLAQ